MAAAVLKFGKECYLVCHRGLCVVKSFLRFIIIHIIIVAYKENQMEDDTFDLNKKASGVDTALQEPDVKIEEEKENA